MCVGLIFAVICAIVFFLYMVGAFIALSEKNDEINELRAKFDNKTQGILLANQILNIDNEELRKESNQMFQQQLNIVKQICCQLDLTIEDIFEENGTCKEKEK